MTHSELYERFLAIRGLKENWNGYGATPISRAAIDRAEKIAGLLINPKINVCPTANNSVQIEFDSDSTYVEIEVFEDHEEIFCEFGEE